MWRQALAANPALTAARLNIAMAQLKQGDSCRRRGHSSDGALVRSRLGGIGISAGSRIASKHALSARYTSFSMSSECDPRVLLASQIRAILDRRKLTQAEAAKVLGVHQPQVSLLRHGMIQDFSLERLLRFLVALGQGVEIRVGRTRHPKIAVTSL